MDGIWPSPIAITDLVELIMGVEVPILIRISNQLRRKSDRSTYLEDSLRQPVITFTQPGLSPKNSGTALVSEPNPPAICCIAISWTKTLPTTTTTPPLIFWLVRTNGSRRFLHKSDPTVLYG